jgi:hypothetical protein
MLNKFLDRRFQNWTTLQDNYIRVAIYAVADLVDMSDLPVKVCKSHKEFYCDLILEYGPGDEGYTRDVGAESRTINNMICEGLRLSINATKSRTEGMGRVVLPKKFEVQATGHFIGLKNLFSGHIFPHLSNNDLLTLARTCKFANNIVMSDTLFGMAIDFSREQPVCLRYENLEEFARKFYYEAKTFHANYFTRFAKSFPLDFKIINARDMGDATLIDNPQANGDCHQCIESRRYFTLVTNGILFEVSLVLKRDYCSVYQHGIWKTHLNYRTQPVEERQKVIRLAKSVEIGKHVAYIEFKCVSDYSFNEFSHEGPGNYCLPVAFGNLWELEELEEFTGSNKEEILTTIKISEDRYLSYIDEPSIWNDETGDTQEDIIDGLISLTSKIIKPLAIISFGKRDGETYMRLLKNQYNSEIFHLEQNDLPLNKIRFPPKEWRKFDQVPYRLTRYDGDGRPIVEEITYSLPRGWNEFFTLRDTINEGYIVFEM